MLLAGRIGLMRACCLWIGMAALLLAACGGPTAIAPTPGLPTASQPNPIASTAAPVAPTTIPPVAPTAAPIAPTTTLPPTLVPVAITIDTPPPGTVVGSPVVITGHVNRRPSSGQLRYRFADQSGQQIAAGTFPAGDAGQGTQFTAELAFAAPAGGGNIRVELFDASASGTSAVLDLFVAPPQAISFSSPPPGTLVGSPVVVTGQLARLPFQSNLFYRFVNTQGQDLGSGLVPVNGAPGQPTSFGASLSFRLPVDGGNIRLELFDQNAADGAVAASSSLALRVAPQQQAITIETPPPGTQVGSPVVITGRTVRYPYQGKLNYRVSDQNGGQLSAGAFNVSGTPGGSATFNASIDFNPPPAGGPIQVQLYDQNAQTGVIVATTSISLQVAALLPTPAPQQVITIETPPPRTLVGSPVVVTGRTSRSPFGGRLNYAVRGTNGQEIGSGVFPVNAAPDQGSTFVASLAFRQLPADTSIRVEIFERDDRSGAIIAIASVDLRIEPFPR